jgi:hypothetical protein
LKDLGNTVTFVGDTTNQSVSHHRNSQNIQLTSGESLIAINTNNQTVTITTTHHYQRTHHIEKNNYYQTVHQYRTVVQQKTFVAYVTTAYYYNVWVYPYSPIILDLDGSGEPDVANHEWLPHAPKFYTQHMTVFDMIGNGVPILTEWVGPHAGILCVPDQNGKVTSALQLFGTAGGFDDGYEKLSLLDKNHDGVLTGDELKGLYVWIDKNGNGKVDPGELYTVQELGITAISVREHNFKSWYVRNGKKLATWDWWPSVLSLVPIQNQPKIKNDDFVPSH